MKGFFEGRRAGFYVSIILAILSCVTAFVSSTSYGKYASMSKLAFWLLVGSAIAALVLSALRLGRFSRWLQAGAIFLAVLEFIKTQYSYVAVVLVGIDLNTFSPQFTICAVLLCVCLVIGIINIYLKQEEKNVG